MKQRVNRTGEELRKQYMVRLLAAGRIANPESIGIQGKAVTDQAETPSMPFEAIPKSESFREKLNAFILAKDSPVRWAFEEDKLKTTTNLFILMKYLNESTAHPGSVSLYDIEKKTKEKLSQMEAFITKTLIASNLYEDVSKDENYKVLQEYAAFNKGGVFNKPKMMEKMLSKNTGRIPLFIYTNFLRHKIGEEPLTYGGNRKLTILELAFYLQAIDGACVNGKASLARTYFGIKKNGKTEKRYHAKAKKGAATSAAPQISDASFDVRFKDKTGKALDKTKLAEMNKILNLHGIVEIKASTNPSDKDKRNAFTMKVDFKALVTPKPKPKAAEIKPDEASGSDGTTGE